MIRWSDNILKNKYGYFVGEFRPDTKVLFGNADRDDGNWAIFGQLTRPTQEAVVYEVSKIALLLNTSIAGDYLRVKYRLKNNDGGEHIN